MEPPDHPEQQQQAAATGAHPPRRSEYLASHHQQHPTATSSGLVDLHYHLLSTDRRYFVAFHSVLVGLLALIVLLGIGSRRRHQRNETNSTMRTDADDATNREARRRRALRRFDRPNDDEIGEVGEPSAPHPSSSNRNNNDDDNATPTPCNKRQKISEEEQINNSSSSSNNKKSGSSCINDADAKSERPGSMDVGGGTIGAATTDHTASIMIAEERGGGIERGGGGTDGKNMKIGTGGGDDTRKVPGALAAKNIVNSNIQTPSADPEAEVTVGAKSKPQTAPTVVESGKKKADGGPKKEEEETHNRQPGHDTSARHGQEPRALSKKDSSKPSLRPAPPPVQILCETLSLVCNADVAVKPGGGGPWGGYGWAKKKYGRSRRLASSSPSSSSTIILPLVDMQDAGGNASTEGRGPRGTEWARLETALSSMVSSDELNPFRKIIAADGGSMPTVSGSGGSRCNLKAIASLYAKCHGSSLRDAIDQASRGFGSYDVVADDKISLERCVKGLAKYCAGSIAKALEVDVSSDRSGVDDGSDDEEDLFSDDYKKVESVNATMNQSTSLDSATGQFLALCSMPNASLTISKDLLEDIFSESSDPSHLTLALVENTMRGPGMRPVQGNGAASSGDTAMALTAISHLFRNSSDVCAAVVSKMKSDSTRKEPLSGSDLEESSLLRHMIMLGGMTVPCAGFEGGILASSQDMRLYESLKSVETFPLGAFDPSSGFRLDAAILKVMEEARTEMRLARSTSAIALESCMRRGGKPHVLRWIGRLIESNEQHANFLGDQLFDPNDEAHGTLSSRSALLGISSALLKMSCANLVQAYDRNPSSFDPRYLLSINSAFDFPRGEAYLVGHGDVLFVPQDSTTFSGATELFFVTSALLRISLFPALRIQKEFSHRYQHVFDRLMVAAKEHGVRVSVPENLSRYAGGLLGLEALLDDRELIAETVSFCTLQLRFVSDLVDRIDAAKVLAMLPEYMAKLPAQFIAHAAQRHQMSISPLQGEQVIASATKLLGAGLDLSTTVQIDLISICSAFVKSGIQRALARKKGAGRRKRGSNYAPNEGVIDHRGLDIYTSLDRNDHGVTVFTSTFVANRLGSALIKSFVALNLATFDAERENIHKNQAQSDIADLILRLWAHPSGDCRRSITVLSQDILSDFLRSVCATIGIEMDCVFQSLYDIADIIRQKPRNSSLGYNETRTMDSRASALASFLGQSRRFLMLLACLSEDDRIASIIGGSKSTVSKDMSSLVVSILDKLTSANGSTNRTIDFREFHLSPYGESQKGTSMSHPAEELLYARLFVRTEFGLDVSLLCHLLLGLCSRWHSASTRLGQGDGLADCITSNDDFDPSHWHNIFRRFVATHQDVDEMNNARDKTFIEKTDGHVAPWVWNDKYEPPNNLGLEHSKRSREYSSQQDQFSHAHIDQKVASINEIGSFVSDLGQRYARTENSLPNDTSIATLEQAILRDSVSGSFDDEDYTNYLKDWIVSSDSFTNGNLGALDHFYAANVQAASNPSLGKRLIKDAKRVWKDLPPPHPAASIFTCYSEERMDIARSIIVGAEGTPYSLGLFTFDLCYPQVYPSTAPLVHFMTTGGGTIRFHPNLYNDGKVCLSLLGTTSAGDTSQRWNPAHSSLAQVLLSIQSQILSVAEPFFSEGGGHGGLRNTLAGIEGSARYNASLRLATLRYAIIAPLKSPPRGFEDVVHRHFAMSRKRLLVQSKVWTLEARGTELYSRYLRAYSELSSLLADRSLKIRSNWELNGDASESEEIGAITPLRSDLDRLAELDTKVYRDFQSLLGQSGGQSEDPQDTEVILTGASIHLDNSPLPPAAAAAADDDDLQAINDALLAEALALSLAGQN